VQRIDHVQLAMPVGAEDLAVAFYQDLLGLPRQPKPAVLAGRGGAWFGGSDVNIHLGVEEDFRPARKAHPALVVTDLAGLTAVLAAGGHPVSAGERLDGRARVYVDDPFGNRIELIEAG